MTVYTTFLRAIIGEIIWFLLSESNKPSTTVFDKKCTSVKTEVWGWILTPLAPLSMFTHTSALVTTEICVLLEKWHNNQGKSFPAERLLFDLHSKLSLCPCSSQGNQIYKSVSLFIVQLYQRILWFYVPSFVMRSSCWQLSLRWLLKIENKCGKSKMKSKHSAAFMSRSKL